MRRLKHYLPGKYKRPKDAKEAFFQYMEEHNARRRTSPRMFLRRVRAYYSKRHLCWVVSYEVSEKYLKDV